MRNNTQIIRFLYGTGIGRLLIKFILHFHLDRPIIRFLWSHYSKPIIGWYIKHNNIPISKQEQKTFGSYRDFFIRAKNNVSFDTTPGHLISPCDGWLKYYTIDEHSCFFIKNSYYRLADLLKDTSLSKNYHNGICLVFRLCASDYHHYCYIDDGYQGSNHYIAGCLHSVQSIACEKYPVYTLNKRCWSLLTTEHFGPVVQCEIGALIVGGIINPNENIRFRKGSLKGHFELAGSTIVLLFEPGQIQMLPKLTEQLSYGDEIRVSQGDWIATAERRNSPI